MQMSVLIGLCGSYDLVTALITTLYRNLLGPNCPSSVLLYIGRYCIHVTRLASRPLKSYTAIQCYDQVIR